MRISVALCTYNGSRYLSEQLDSIARQTHLPDELHICDDQSADGTVSIAQAFVERVKFPVHIHINAQNFGVSTNFSNAIDQCTGDIIFLADQDDVWRKDKIARTVSIFRQFPDPILTFSNAEIVSDALEPLGYSLWDSIGFNSKEQMRFLHGESFSCLMKRYRVTGATTAFRSQLTEMILPIPSTWLHDAWISMIASALFPIHPINDSLIQYRQHSSQQIGGSRMSLLAEYRVAAAATAKKFAMDLENFTSLQTRLDSLATFPVARRHLLTNKIDHIRRRLEMRHCRWRVPSVVAETLRGGYFRYSRGWKAIAQDLLLG